MTPETAAWVTSAAASGLLAQAMATAPSGELALQTRLRGEGHDPAQVAAVLAVVAARRRASTKFGAAADRMFFTPDGLEQATRPELAARHTARFVRAGVTMVADLGCGIGSDALAFATAGVDVLAVEADPATSAFARANLAPWSNARVVTARAEQVPLPGEATGRHTDAVGVWVDPGRRVRGVADARGRSRRVFALEEMDPTWDQVCRWAEQVPATGAKLSPAFPHGRIPSGVEAHWTSWLGEVLECALWWGPLALAAGRTAAVCRPDGRGGVTEAVVTEADAAAGSAATSLVLSGARDLGSWLWEADKAVVRAGVTGALPGRELTRGIGLSTGDAGVEVPWARRYAVLEAMPARPKVVRAWLRERGVGTLTLKKRGVALDPDRFRQETGRLTGDGAATFVLTTVGGAATAIALG